MAAAPNIINIFLQRPTPTTPWGFRVQGGADTGHPLFVQRITPGTIASQRLNPGDVILQIRGKPTNCMKYVEANDEINCQTNAIELTVQKRIPLGYEEHPNQFVNQGYNDFPCQPKTTPTPKANAWAPQFQSGQPTTPGSASPRTHVMFGTPDLPNVQKMPVTTPPSPGVPVWANNAPQCKQQNNPTSQNINQGPKKQNVPSPPPRSPEMWAPVSQVNQGYNNPPFSPTLEVKKASPTPINQPTDSGQNIIKPLKMGPAGGIAVFPGMLPNQHISPLGSPTSENAPTILPSPSPPESSSVGVVAAPPPPPPPPPPAPPPPPPAGSQPTWRQLQDAVCCYSCCGKKTKTANDDDKIESEDEKYWPSEPSEVKKATAAQEEAKTGYHPSQHSASKPGEGADKPFCYFPPGLANTLQKKDKKPFTYTPTGLDLTQIKSPRMQNRIINNISDKYTVQSADGPRKPKDAQNNQPQSVGSSSLAANTRPTQVLPTPPAPPPPPPPKPAPQHNFKTFQKAPPMQQDPSPPIGYYRQPQEKESPVGRRQPQDFNNSQNQSIPAPDVDQQHRHPQSRSFRLLQKFTGEEEDDDRDDVPKIPRQKQEEETRFSGIGNNDPVPSKSFQRLQKFTGDSQPHNQPPPPPPLRSDSAKNDAEIYDEANPRYRGGKIPSRSFRMLQEITGVTNAEVDDTPVALRKKEIMNEGATPDRKISDVPPSQQEAEAEPKKYTGGSIPSRSFRMLQFMTGEDNDDDPGKEGEGVTDF
ncbi:LIM domain-binding protein 3 [Nymphon striatum]|nr:LIM domain-binding protein 3 [Nymphon striatum]